MANGLNYGILCGALFSLMLASDASAQTSGGTSCLVAPASLPDSSIQAFLSSPSGLLSEFQTGGILMSNRVRALVGTDPAVLAPTVGLASQANPFQIAALGAGLARAAAACVPVNPEFAARIQQEVADTDNPALQTAFAGASPETETAALGAAGAGGGGASAIGSNGNAGGGVNATSDSAGAGATGTASGNSAFSAGASPAYFATSSAASSTIIAVSVTSQ